MRTLNYYLTLSEHEGYIITNAGSEWETMPQRENLSNPPIRLMSSKNGSGDDVDLAKHVKLREESPHCPLFVPVDACFAANYHLALQDQLAPWKLVGVRIGYDCISMMFASMDNHGYELAYLEPAEDLEIILEVTRDNGAIDRYLLEASENLQTVMVTEYGCYGCREFAFSDYARKSDGSITISVKEVC